MVLIQGASYDTIARQHLYKNNDKEEEGAAVK